MTDMMKKPTKSNRTILLVYGFMLASCLGLAWFKTRPDVVDFESNGHQLKFSLPLQSSWQQCAETAILFSPGSWEWVGIDPEAKILNWASGTAAKLPLPHPNAWKTYMFSQSPDCTTVVISEGSDMYLVDVSSGKTEPLGTGLFPTFSPAGDQVAYVQGEDVWIKSIGDGRASVMLAMRDWLSDEWTGIGGFSWGGKGLTAVLRALSNREAGNTTKLVVFSLQDGHVDDIEAEITGGWLGQPVISPDGGMLAYVNQIGTPKLELLTIYDIERRCVVAKTPLDYGGDVFWSPDGRDLVVQAGIRLEAEQIAVSELLPLDRDTTCVS